MNITFNNVRIRSAHIGANETKIHFSAGWAAKVREVMEWGDVPAGWEGGKLSGELIGQNIVLIPNDKKLASYELQAGIGNVGGFALVVTEHDDEGKPKAREVRFHAVSQQEGVSADIENYIRKIGEAPATLKISYTEQMTLGEGKGVETGGDAD
jgi:hypothetical protein